MTGRTLEEIEALAAEATPGPWAMNTDPPYDSVVGSDGRTVCCDTAYYPTAVSIEDMRLIAALPDLLAIAQGQREEIARLRAVHDAAEALRAGTTRPFGLALERLRDASESASKTVGTKK